MAGENTLNNEQQGGDYWEVGGSLVLTSTGIFDASLGTVTMPAGGVALTKISFTGLKVLAGAGHNNTGACTVTGAAVGDRLIAVFGTVTGGGTLLAKVPGTDFESVVTVVDQVQQLASANLSGDTFLFILAPATA